MWKKITEMIIIFALLGMIPVYASEENNTGDLLTYDHVLFHNPNFTVSVENTEGVPLLDTPSDGSSVRYTIPYGTVLLIENLVADEASSQYYGMCEYEGEIGYVQIDQFLSVFDGEGSILPEFLVLVHTGTEGAALITEEGEAIPFPVPDRTLLIIKDLKMFHDELYGRINYSAISGYISFDDIDILHISNYEGMDGFFVQVDPSEFTSSNYLTLKDPNDREKQVLIPKGEILFVPGICNSLAGGDALYFITTYDSVTGMIDPEQVRIFSMQQAQEMIQGNPEGNNDASSESLTGIYAAYRDVLLREQDKITLAENRKDQITAETTNKIVFCDICGDEMPEMIYAEIDEVQPGTVSVPEYNSVDLHIVTYEEGTVRELHKLMVEKSQMSAGTENYYLFLEEGDRSLYLYRSSSAQGSSQSYYRFRSGEITPLISENLLKHSSGQGDYGAYDRYSSDNTDISENEYNRIESELQKNTRAVLMYSPGANEFVRTYTGEHGYYAMTFNDALQWLEQAAAEGNTRFGVQPDAVITTEPVVYVNPVAEDPTAANIVMNVNNNIENPNIPTEVRSVYRTILMQDQTAIDAYDNQKTVFDEVSGIHKHRGNVVFRDVYGDETPEMLYIKLENYTGNPTDSGPVNLHIVTYEDGGAREVYSGEVSYYNAGGQSFYFLFQLNGEKTLYDYLYFEDDLITEEYHRFDFSDLWLSEKELLCQHRYATWNDNSFIIVNGKPAGEEQLQMTVSDLLQNIDTVLLYNWGCNEKVEPYLTEKGCPAMTCAEALIWLDQGAPDPYTSFEVPAEGQDDDLESIW